MDSPSRLSVDEAHCLWPLCSHTGCWEAEQRLRTGKPRKVKTLTPHRASATASEEYRFPVITVVNASDWPDAGSPNELFPLKSEDDFPEAAANTLSSQAALPRGARTLKNVQSPIFSSAVPADLEIHRENKPVKVSTVHISPLPSYISTSQSIVMWVPSSGYLPPRDSQHSAKSHRLAVKKLIFHPSAENRSFETKDKSRKRAVQKQRPLKSQLNQERKGSLDSGADSDLRDLSWLGSESDLSVKKAPAPPQVRRLVPDPEAKEDQQPPRATQTLHLRKKPVWGMIQRKHTQEEHEYKRDLQTGRDRIDWESLRRQAYLWRRYAQPVSSKSMRPSSAEDKADYVPYSLHPVSILSSQCLFKSSSTKETSEMFELQQVTSCHLSSTI